MESIDSWLPARQQVPSKHSSTQVFTNLYQLRIDRLPSHYYLYIPQLSESTATLNYARHFHRYSSDPGHFYQKIGYISRYKRGFLGSKKIDQPLKIQQIEEEKTNKCLQICLSGPNEVTIQEIVGEKGGSPALRASLGASFQRSMNKKSSTSKIYSYGSFQFKATTECKLTITYFNRKLCLATDSYQKINQNRTVLHYLQKYSRSEAAELLEGIKLVKNYGDRASFYLCSIDYSLNPSSKMAESEETFQQYYKRKYQIKVNDASQPLIIARKSSVKREGNTSKTIMLIPELVAIEDRSCQPDYPKEIDSRLRSLKQLPPNVKEGQINEIISSLAAEDVIKKSALRLEAVCLNHPVILMNGCQIYPEEGVFDFRNRILFSPELRSWAVAYSATKGGEEKEEAEDIISYFRNLTRIYGVNILSNPSQIVIKGPEFSSWKSALQENFKTFGKLQIVLVLLKEEEYGLYSAIKELLTLKLKCISQVVKKSTLFGSNNKKPYAIATDIMIQMITKIGATPWGIQPTKSTLSNSLIMQGAMHFQKRDDTDSVSFVGFTNKEQSQTYSAFRGSLKDEEQLRTFENNVFLNWAKKFVVTQKVPAETIILFKEGRENLKRQADFEMRVLEALVKKIGEKTKRPNYAPTIVYIEVHRQKAVEFYSRSESNSSSICLENVPCGTVLFEQPVDKKHFRFYLNSQYKLSASTKPVVYRASCNNDRVDRQQLAQLVYEQCYNYYNYAGSIAVPGILQYACKMSRLAGSFKADLQSDSKLADVPYFL